MGKIDKEKLLDVLKKHFPNYKDYKVIAELELAKNAIELVENFPEEPEIDFDALYKDLLKDCGDSCTKDESCKACVFDFLKSKNLTVQKPVEIPVKKTWTLKKEYEKYSRIIGHTPTTLIVDPTVAPDPEFYDYKEDPDYSKIPKGSIVEIECLGDKFYRTFVKFERGNVFTKEVGEIEQWSPNVIIRVVELAKE